VLATETIAMTTPGPVAAAAGRVLVADDQPDVLHSLRLFLKRLGLEVETASSPAAVVQHLTQRFDLVLMDMNYARDTTSGQEGLELLARIRDLDAKLPVVVMTAWGSVDVAVEAMRRGARDFVQKPWENERLATIVRNQLDWAKTLRTMDHLAGENRALRPDLPDLVAQSSAMQRVLELVRRVGPSDANVLVTGENGTGKGVIARLLHQASGRAGKPLITVDVGALSESLLESELFGHVRGAFTDARTDREGRFELADGATLFLDEVANLPLGQQSKLLRVLETGEFERVGSSRTRKVDARVIAATNANLQAEVAAGRFRQDLRFRLNTVEIRLPPLRERPADIAPLAARFTAQFAHKYRRPVTDMHPAALEAMRSYPWPGNIRELAHAVERAVLMASGETIMLADLGLEPLPHPLAMATATGEGSLEQLEAGLIRKAIDRCSGNVEAAAVALGLSRSALYRRIKKLGV
jgi:DNA-binding NtrC family response regulator